MTQPSDIVAFAREVLGVELYPVQAAELRAYYQSGRPNWLCLSGRRGGKSLMSDIIACYEGIVPAFGDILRPGEDRHILIVSVRQDNAALHIRNIVRLLKHTRAVGKLIKFEGRDRIELSNGAIIMSLPASARAGRGFTASTLIFDELAFFVDTDGNASGDAVFDAFSPTVATFGDQARIIVTTTPAARSGIVFDLFDRQLPDWYITKQPTTALNPRVSQKVIDRAIARDPESAQVEYYAEFRDPVESFLSGDAIQRAIKPEAQRLEHGTAGAAYAMAIDPATMGDRYAFVIGYRDDADRVVLAYSHIMIPPVDPNAAEALLHDLVRRFKPFVIRCDTASTVQRLQGDLSQLEYTPFSRQFKLKIYGALKETLNLDRLVLYDDPDLIDELKALQIRNGVDIAAPKSGRVKHDDLADCLALVCDVLSVGLDSLEPAGEMNAGSMAAFRFSNSEF